MDSMFLKVGRSDDVSEINGVKFPCGNVCNNFPNCSQLISRVFPPHLLDLLPSEWLKFRQEVAAVLTGRFSVRQWSKHVVIGGDATEPC